MRRSRRFRFLLLRRQQVCLSKRETVCGPAGKPGHRVGASGLDHQQPRSQCQHRGQRYHPQPNSFPLFGRIFRLPAVQRRLQRQIVGLKPLPCRLCFSRLFRLAAGQALQYLQGQCRVFSFQLQPKQFFQILVGHGHIIKHLVCFHPATSSPFIYVRSFEIRDIHSPSFSRRRCLMRWTRLRQASREMPSSSAASR